ncbi:hypothetical protein GQR36_12435 [Enterococcus termitis]
MDREKQNLNQDRKPTKKRRKKSDNRSAEQLRIKKKRPQSEPQIESRKTTVDSKIAPKEVGKKQLRPLENEKNES